MYHSIDGGVDQDGRQQTLRAPIQQAGEPASRGEDQDRIQDRIEQGWMFTQRSIFIPAAQVHAGSVSQPEEQGSKTDTGERRASEVDHASLDETTEEEFLHKAGFDDVPEKCDRYAKGDLSPRKLTRAQWSGSTSHEEVESAKEQDQHYGNDQLPRDVPPGEAEALPTRVPKLPQEEDGKDDKHRQFEKQLCEIGFDK